MILPRKKSSTENGRGVIEVQTVKRCPIIGGDHIDGMKRYFQAYIKSQEKAHDTT